MNRTVTSRKPWQCDGCGQQMEAGTIKTIQRSGHWIELPSFGRVHVDGDWSYCQDCVDGKGQQGCTPTS